jgi:ribosome maturation factor RimP
MVMEDKIRNLLQQAIMDAGYILDEVKYYKEGSVNTLMLVIDKDGIVDINDCVNINNIVNPILDDSDPIKDSYVLDVCSKEKGCD